MHVCVDMAAIGDDVVQPGTRDQSALRARMLVADRVVIRIEQHAKRRMEWPVPGNVRHQHEGLEEPAGVRQMPFDRARIANIS